MDNSTAASSPKNDAKPLEVKTEDTVSTSTSAAVKTPTRRKVNLKQLKKRYHSSNSSSASSAGTSHRNIRGTTSSGVAVASSRNTKQVVADRNVSFPRQRGAQSHRGKPCPTEKSTRRTSL